MLDELKDVFELATGATAFVKSILELKKNNKKQEEGDAVIKSSGDFAKIGSSGDYAQIGSSGDSAKIGSSGDSAKIGSSGYYAQIGSSGDSAKIGSSGYYAQIGSSGDSAKIGSSGDYAQIGSSGDYAQIGSSGDSAKIGSSGDSAQIESIGLTSVIAAIGFWSVAKGKKGSWLTLAEYRTDENNRLYPYFVKTEYIDGERIKEDTFYGLYNKEFREVIEVDGIKSLLVSTKGNVQKVVLNKDFEPSYIFTKDGISAHGKSVKQTYRDWLFKQSDRDASKYKSLDPNKKHNVAFWYECYRTITGACALGTEHFIEQNKDKKEATLREVIELTKGQYGHNSFKEFFEREEND